MQMLPPPPGHYSNNVSVSGSKHTITIAFSINEGPPNSIVYLPPAVAKMMAMTLRKGLKELEESAGEIMLSEDDYRLMNIHSEDW